MLICSHLPFQLRQIQYRCYAILVSLQAVAVLLIILAHDGLLVWGGFALANKYYGIRLDASHVAVNQALQVYGDPTSGNPFHNSQRSDLLQCNSMLCYCSQTVKCCFTYLPVMIIGHVMYLCRLIQQSCMVTYLELDCVNLSC